MRTAETEREFETFIGSRGFERQRLDAPTAFDLTIEWYLQQRIEDCVDGLDQLLFQWGTYDWGSGPSFQLDLTRQFIRAGQEDDDAIWQLHLTLHYSPDPALGQGQVWCDGPEKADVFRNRVLTTGIIDDIAGLTPDQIEIRLENAG